MRQMQGAAQTSVQFKRQVLECKQKLIKSTYKIKEALYSDESESGLPDLYDLTDDDMVDRNGTLTDFDDDDDEPLASLWKTEVKHNIARLKDDTEDQVPRTKKLKKKSKLKKIKKKEKTQDSEINKIDIEVEMNEVAETKDIKKRAIDPSIIDVDQEDDDVVFVKNVRAVPGFIELKQDDNNQEIVDVIPVPEVAAVDPLLEQNNANQDENVDVMETLPEPEPAPQLEPTLELEPEPEPASQLEPTPELEPEPTPELEPEPTPELEPEPEPEMEVKAENIENDDDEDDPIRILNNIEVIPEALPEEVPDPLNGINVIPEISLEPKEEVDCVSSTIDDSQIINNTIATDNIQPHMSTVQTSAVKNIDAIFNCTLREMLSRPSNILQDMNRRGHDMMQGFNERIPVTPAKPDPQLRTVRRPRRTNAEEVPRRNTSKESRVKKNVSNYLDLLR